MSGIKTGIAAAALAATMGLSGDAPAAASGAGGWAERFVPICNHYENRARYKPRDPAPELVVHFAESCRVALDQLRAGADGDLAERYLERLAEFQRLTVYMLLQNMWASPSADTGLAGAGHRQIGLSATGEYLIARYMGLTGAYDDWAAETGFTIAAQQ